MQICLVGPSYPFRGGIAHYTTLLYHHLRQRHRVTWYAFRRQYPRWLFPGQTDRDPSQVPLRAEETQATLDSLNPLTWWEVAKSIQRAKPDLVILSWWTSFWAPQLWTISTLVKRASGTQLFFICHNVVDHEAHRFSRVLARAALKRGDHFLVHAEREKEQLRELLPASAVTQVFHPVYDFFHSAGLSQRQARQQLGLAGEVLLFFGFIRPYKGLDILLEAMPLVLARRAVTLLVVGEFWERRARYLRRIEELGIGAAVKIVDGYIPNEQVEQYFAAADLVVLPYVGGTGSGIVQIAYGLNKPVVATRVGCLPEVVDDGNTGYVVNPNDPQALAEAVVRFFAEEKEDEFVANIQRGKGRFAWEHLVGEIEALAGQHWQAAGQ
jgi:glycosyltransferase involved in cell wall biosynthesis